MYLGEDTSHGSNERKFAAPFVFGRYSTNPVRPASIQLLSHNLVVTQIVDPFHFTTPFQRKSLSS